MSLKTIWHKYSSLVVEKEKRCHTTCINCVMTDNKKYIVMGGLDGTIKLFQHPILECIRTLTAHKDCINALVFTIDGYLISASDDCSMIFWDFKNGVGLKKLTNHKKSVSCAICIDNKYFHKLYSTNFKYYIVSGSWDTSIKVWNLSTNRVIVQFQGHTEPIKSLLYDNVKGLLHSSDLNGEIRIWDIRSITCLIVIKAHNGKIWTMSKFNQFNNIKDGFITSGADCKIKVWDIDFKCQNEFSDCKGSILKVINVNSDCLVFTSSTKSFQILNTSINKAICKNFSPETIFDITTFGTDRFVIAAGYSLKVYTIVNKKCLFFQIIQKVQQKSKLDNIVIKGIHDMLFGS